MGRPRPPEKIEVPGCSAILKMLMKKYLVEFIGTFFLVLTVGMTVIEPGAAGGLAPLAIGSALMVMVYAGGHVSGGHYNPAVTVAVWLRGRCSQADVPGCLGSQVAAGIVAAFVVLGLKGDPSVSAKTIDVFPAFIAELVGTFALAYVVLNVATAKGTTGNSDYGPATGFRSQPWPLPSGPYPVALSIPLSRWASPS
jgi:aquaporin Z